MDQQSVSQNNDTYATLAGQVNEFMVQRVFQNLVIASSQRVEHLHILMQSTGGAVGDGIAIYNFIKNLPMRVTAYNGGLIQSIGVVAFLGAKERKASKTASFMIHRSHFSSGIPATSSQLQGIAEALTLHDTITESIFREHLKMPEDKWNIHRHADLFLSADQALEYGLIDEISDFAPPLGATIFNIVQ